MLRIQGFKRTREGSQKFHKNEVLKNVGFVRRRFLKKFLSKESHMQFL